MRLNTATSHISVSVHRHGTKHMDSNPCVDSVFHPRRFTEHGTPTTTVGGRGFANRRQVSWTRAEFRELDSQTWNRNIWRSLQFLGFLVERPPTHSLQFAEPLSTRTRRIPGSVRKLGTNTVPATHCKDSLSRPRRFANLGTPTRAAAVPVPIFVDRCAIPWTRIQYRQPRPQRSRLKTAVMSIAIRNPRGASDD